MNKQQEVEMLTGRVMMLYKKLNNTSQEDFKTLAEVFRQMSDVLQRLDEITTEEDA